MRFLGAQGLDREVGGKEACRVSTCPKSSRVKNKGRLGRARLGCLMQPHHLGFPPTLSPEWCKRSGIASPDAYRDWRSVIGYGREKPVSGCSPFEIKNTD